MSEPESTIRTVPSDRMPGDNGRALLTEWRAFNARLNALPLELLRSRYDEVGFLYPEKRTRLEPYWAEIDDGWSRTMSAGDSLRRSFSWQSADGTRWAAVELWRATERSWWVQHLVANGGGAGSVATMLAATARSFADPWLVGCEAWYRPTNSFARRMLGGGADALGRQGGRATHRYLRVPLGISARTPPTLRIRMVTEATGELQRLAAECRHPAFPAITALTEDPLLQAVDRRYRRVGLRRYRRILTATDRTGRLLGAALAHRGPLGMNYSFLENRCDLLLAQTTPDQAATTAQTLAAAAAETYQDFPPGFIPVMVTAHRPTDTDIDQALGGDLLQTYAQAVWLRAGLPQLANYFHQTATGAGRPVP
jgi:hypothetical protein